MSYNSFWTLSKCWCKCFYHQIIYSITFLVDVLEVPWIAVVRCEAWGGGGGGGSDESRSDGGGGGGESRGGGGSESRGGGGGESRGGAFNNTLTAVRSSVEFL